MYVEYTRENGAPRYGKEDDNNNNNIVHNFPL